MTEEAEVAQTVVPTHEEAAPAWHWSSNEDNPVAGTGDRPEYLQTKYNSVEAQAQAYPELAKKFGSFTGAPDEYNHDFLGEDFERGDSFDSAGEMMRELGVDQGGYEKLMAFHNAEIDAVVKQYNDPEGERAALGADAQSRLDTVDTFLRNNLDAEMYEDIAATVTTADSVKLVEALIGATSPKKLPSEGGENVTGATEEDLTKMLMALDDNGERKYNDPTYRKYVDGEWARFYGTKAGHKIIG